MHGCACDSHSCNTVNVSTPFIFRYCFSHYSFKKVFHLRVLNKYIHTYITSCLGNIQRRWAPTTLVSCCHSRFLNASCFMRHNGCSIHIPHPLNWVSCSLLTLGSSHRFWALARQWSFAGMPFFIFRFVSNFSRLYLSFSLSRKRKKLATEFDPSLSELAVAY